MGEDSALSSSMVTDNDEWVTLDMRLLNWNYMNFKLCVRTDTRMFAIKRQIQQRHGRITDLKICKEQFCERNELVDEMKTLKEYGIRGSTESKNEAMCLIYYDFKPCDHADPLLLVT